MTDFLIGHRADLTHLKMLRLCVHSLLIIMNSFDNNKKKATMSHYKEIFLILDLD